MDVWIVAVTRIKFRYVVIMIMIGHVCGILIFLCYLFLLLEKNFKLATIKLEG